MYVGWVFFPLSETNVCRNIYKHSLIVGYDWAMYRNIWDIMVNIVLSPQGHRTL